MAASAVSEARVAASSRAAPATALGILLTLSVCHLLNDRMQSLLPAIYPMLKRGFSLDFGQIGLITLTNQLTASLLQPGAALRTPPDGCAQADAGAMAPRRGPESLTEASLPYYAS